MMIKTAFTASCLFALVFFAAGFGAGEQPATHVTTSPCAVQPDETRAVRPLPVQADGSVDVSRIYGRIQFVDSFPDYKVKVVDSFPDLKVKIVDAFPDSAGKWQIVDSFPDYKIQLVESFPDFKVKYVDSFPGPAR